MGFARASGAVVLGIEGHLVEVEAHIGPGLPEFRLVGLPDAAVRESRERVRAALRQCGLALPAGRITVNLAPARLPKFGSSLDLAIACAVLAASGRLAAARLAGWLLAGEVSLDGSLRSVDGIIALLTAARRAGLVRAVVPRQDGGLAGWVRGVQVWPAGHLTEVVAVLGHDGRSAAPFPPVAPQPEPELPGVGEEALGDLADVRGQVLGRRALEIAAAGGHHLMLVGPPGSGKTMLAHRLPSILPPLSQEEWLEVVQVYSAAGRLGGGAPGTPFGPGGRRRPFRAPHHTVTRTALIGGGSRLAPGEWSLAHRGVLFLDEFAELGREVVDALREPMEVGWVSLARGQHSLRLPGDVLVVAASNPCPCGWLGAGRGLRSCRCSSGDLARYRRRLAGPLADRFELWAFVRPAERQQLLAGAPGEPSARVRERVAAARDRQRHRWLAQGEAAPFAATPLNGRMSAEQVRRWCRLAPEVEEEALRLGGRLQLHPRALQGMLKVARTLADLEGRSAIGVEHLREAAQFRRSAALWG